MEGEFRLTPVEESIRAVADMYVSGRKNSSHWETDRNFGNDGRIEIIVYRGYADSWLDAAAQALVSEINAQLPFSGFARQVIGQVIPSHNEIHGRAI